jgi:hypothetical protein
VTGVQTCALPICTALNKTCCQQDQLHEVHLSLFFIAFSRESQRYR